MSISLNMGNFAKSILFVISVVHWTEGKSIHRQKKIKQDDIWVDANKSSTNDGTANCHVTRNDNVMDSIYHINTCQGSVDTQLTEFDIRGKSDHVRKRRSSVFDEKFEWEKSMDGMVYIPYIVDFGVSQEVRTAIQSAIQDFNQRTCIRFIPKTSLNQVDFVFIFSSTGCWSYIGKQNGRTEVSLAPQCNSKGIAIHELMHVLGFTHEQGRRDRDEHVKIYWDRILPVHKRQFAMDGYGETVIYGTEYDDQSVMHYGNTIGGKTPGMVTMASIKNPSKTLGQRNGFSMLDLREINLKYKCGKHYVSYD